MNTTRILFITCFLCGLHVVINAQSRSLRYFIELAEVNSPLLTDYRNQSAATRIDSLIVRANYKPQVAGTSVDIYAPTIGGIGYDPAVTNGGGFTAMVGVNQTLAGRKNLNAQFRSIDIQRQGVENAAAISRQDLIKTITGQYITAFGTLQQLNFNREVNKLLAGEEVIVKHLTENNIYRQTDYLTFLVTLKQQQLATRQQEIQFQNDYATLNYLAGIQDTASVTLEDPGLTLTESPDPSNSIFFRQFALDSMGVVNDQLLLDISYKPKVSLFADGGFNSTLAYRPYKNFGTSFGVNLTVPIYDGKKRKLQHEKLGLTQQTTNRYKDFARGQYYQQILQLKQQYRATENLITEIKTQIKYSESLINVNSRLLETGDAKVADLVIALNNYLAARNLLTQNTVSRLQIVNQINYWNR